MRIAAGASEDDSPGAVRMFSGSGQSAVKFDDGTLEMLTIEQNILANHISFDASGSRGNTIEFSVSDRPGADLRLESTDTASGGSIVSTVPMRVTKIEYSSDERIKREVVSRHLCHRSAR